ncbi:MAG: hypothetical protein ACXVFO_02190 [Solirubrobacteraceae bacterium]
MLRAAVSRIQAATRRQERIVGASIGRAQFSFGAVWASESAFMVGLAIVSFRDGGVTAVGAVTAARMAAAALLAPWLATVADRVRRERVLTVVGLIRAAALGAAMVVTAADGPAVVIYALAVVATVAFALFRPAHSALLPALCTSPQQLTRANAVRGLLDSSATLGGPAAAAILLAVSEPAAVLGRARGRLCLVDWRWSGSRTTPRRVRQPQSQPRPTAVGPSTTCRGSRPSRPTAACRWSPGSASYRRSRAAASPSSPS